MTQAMACSQIGLFVEHDKLSCGKAWPSIPVCALQGKQSFEEAGGLTALEPLEYHSNDEIRMVTNHILDTHFYHEVCKSIWESRRLCLVLCGGARPPIPPPP